MTAEIAFSSRSAGWAVGQRCGDPGANGICTLLVSATVDAGHTWPTVVTVGRPTYSQDSSPRLHVRFAGSNGWLYGPGIYGSHDGGKTWHLQDGRPVLSLEVAGSSAWAITGCIRGHLCLPHLITSSAGSDRWIDPPVQPPVVPANDAALERVSPTVSFLAATTGSRTFSDTTQLLVTRDSGGSWTKLAAPCADLRQLRSLDGVVVWALCVSQPGAGSQPKAVYISWDGGRSWELRAQTPYPSAVGTLAMGGYAMTFVVTTSSTAAIGSERGGVSISSDQGRNWSAPTQDVPGGEAGLGVSELWFVDATHGWALGGYGTEGPTLWLTSDGGHHWAPGANPFGTPLVG